MTAWEMAVEWYRIHHDEAMLHHDLACHLRGGGWVWSAPSLLIMARPVDVMADLEMIRDPTVQFPASQWGAWHVFFAAVAPSGDLSTIARLVPFPLPLICWDRGGIFRGHAFGRGLRLISRLTKNKDRLIIAA